MKVTTDVDENSTGRIDKMARLGAKLRDPKWRRCGPLLRAGKSPARS